MKVIIRLFVLVFREFQLNIKNLLLLFTVSLIGMVYVTLVSSSETLQSYSKAIPVVFAISCATILMGLMMSINIICKYNNVIFRELRKGISPIMLILSKTIYMAILCSIISLVFTFTCIYILNINTVKDYNSAFIYFSIFFSILTSAEVGLAISSIPKIDTQKAAYAIPFVMLFQMLFSGFIFEQEKFDSTINLSGLSISNYSIRALGSSLGFNRFDKFGMPYLNFDNSFSNIIVDNVFILSIFSILLIVLSILFLHHIDVKGVK